jgi:hypothetical protein
MGSNSSSRWTGSCSSSEGGGAGGVLAASSLTSRDGAGIFFMVHPNKNKTRLKRSCFKCGKTSHFIAQCPDNDNDQGQEKSGKREKKNYMKAKGEAHLGKEWDSNCSSSDSDDEGLAASAFDKSSLFPNECHTCLMAKEKKIRIRDSPKYSSSSDEILSMMK